MDDQTILRISQIRYELTKPVQSQFIKSDCTFLLGEYDRLVQEHEALATRLADCEEALIRERENSFAMAKAISECLGILEREEG
jgi:hypothetical protein